MTKRRTAAQRRKEKTQAWFKKTFANANRLAKPPEVIRVRDRDTLEANGEWFSPNGHRAIAEIRAVFILIGGPMCAKMRFDDIPKGTANDWTEQQKAAWRTFWLWQDTMNRPDNRGGRKLYRQAFEATLLFVEGVGPRAIEKKIRVRQGVGKARQLLITGVKKYSEIAGW